MQFLLTSDYAPTGDQPEAIRGLVDGIRSGMRNQVLLGATGTGKTFTIASVIQELQMLVQRNDLRQRSREVRKMREKY